MEKIFKLLNKQKGFIQIIPIIILLAGIIGGVYLVQKTQIFRPKATGQPFSTQFGIMYSLWHCDINGNGTVNPPDITETLAGRQQWRGVGAFHYWGRPQLGYYCLTDSRDSDGDGVSNGDEVLIQHAQILGEAGIDFVFLDATNHRYADERGGGRTMIMDPFERMLAVWSNISNAPKIVPWSPATSDSTMIDYLTSGLDSYPNLQFNYQAKPLVLINNNYWHQADDNKVNELRNRYTVKKTWVYWSGWDDPISWGSPIPENVKNLYRQKVEWSFLEPCTPGFKESEGNRACNQLDYRFTQFFPSEQPEALPVSTTGGGVDYGYGISDVNRTIPKFHGQTFVKQFETLFNHSTTPIALIMNWNEWVAIRHCLNGEGHVTADSSQCDPARYPSFQHQHIFIDEYSTEYNRDIEPVDGEEGDFYYRLMKECIRLYKLGQRCSIESLNPSPSPTPTPTPTPTASPTPTTPTTSCRITWGETPSPSADTTFNITINANSCGNPDTSVGWSHVGIRIDGGAWTGTGGSVDRGCPSPIWGWSIPSGSPGTHTVEFGVNITTAPVTCSPPTTFTTTAPPTSTPNPTPSPSLSPAPSASPTFIPTPSPTPQPLVGDINNDNVVNQTDFNLLVADFGGTNSPADLNHDGRVDIIDFNLLLRSYGQTR